MFLTIWPLSARAKKDLTGLLVSILLYIVIAIAIHVVVGILPSLGFVTVVLGIIKWLLDIYLGVGIIVSILVFFKVIS